jgi:hypothetical protein
MKARISMLALAVLLYARPGFAQHGHAPSGTMGNGMGHSNMSANSGSGSGSHRVTIDQQLSNNKAIAGKIASLTRESATQACKGFKNLGQCVAAAHVSKNLGISFDCLKFDMTGQAPTNGTKCTAPATSKSGTTTMSLGKAIQTLSPTVNAKAVAKKATKQADQDLKSDNS